MKTRVFMSTVVFVCIAILTTSAQGVVIPLSTHSSEPISEANGVPASWLDASIDLSVSNNGQWELSVAVTNLTPEHAGDYAFKITKIYFNTSAPVTSLTLDSVDGGNVWEWGLYFYEDSIQCDGFGLFDIVIVSKNLNLAWIDPLETLTFNIIIEPDTSTYTDTDFYDLSSMDGHTGHILAYGAAKFAKTGDPEDLSAYGAYVPEPATIFMLGLGALVLLRKRRD